MNKETRIKNAGAQDPVSTPSAPVAEVIDWHEAEGLKLATMASRSSSWSADKLTEAAANHFAVVAGIRAANPQVVINNIGPVRK